MLIVRRAKRKTQYTKRYLALSATERMDLKALGRCIKYILLVKLTMDSPLPEEMEPPSFATICFVPLMTSKKIFAIIDIAF